MKIRYIILIKMLFCLSLIVTVQVSHGQILFKKLVDFNNKAQGFVEGIVIDSSHIFYCGMTYDTTQKPTALMFDNDGNVLWKTAFGEPAYSHTPKAVIMSHDSNFVMGGQRVRHPSGTIDSSFVCKLDFNGNVLWINKFKSVVQDIIEMPNGNYLFVTRNLNDLEFIQTDPAGNFISITAKKFGGFQDEVKIIASVFGGYYLTGFTRSVAGVNIWNDLLVVKLDPGLNVMWANGYSDTTRTFYKPSILEAPDGSLFVSSQVNDYPLVIGPNTFFDISVMHIDQGGNMIWNNRYINQRNNAPTMHLSGDSLILPAKTYKFTGTSVSDFGQSLLVTDTAGIVLFQNRYSYLSQTWNGDIVPYQNHFLVTSTSALVGSPTGSDFILAHLDSAGNSSCLDSLELYTIATIPFTIYPITVTSPGSISLIVYPLQTFPLVLTQTDSIPCTTVGLKELEQQHQTTLFPNPVDDELNVSGLTQGSNIQIVDAIGKLFYEGEALETTLRLNMSTLSAGIYFVVIRNEKSSYGMKFLKNE